MAHAENEERRNLLNTHQTLERTALIFVQRVAMKPCSAVTGIRAGGSYLSVYIPRENDRSREKNDT
jgi:hypothetical protein